MQSLLAYGLAVVGVYVMVVLVFWSLAFAGVGFPPSLAVILPLFLGAAVGWWAIVIAPLVHGAMFVLANLYLARGGHSVWPTLAGIGILEVLIALYWGSGAYAVGLRYWGAGVTNVFAGLNAATFLGFALALVWIWRREPNAATLVRVHFAAYAAFLTVLFPALGEWP